MIILNTGNTIFILRFKIWSKWYHEYSNGKLTHDWKGDFIEHLFYKYFNDDGSATATKKFDCKSQKTRATPKSRYEYDKKNQVKLSDFPEFSGKSGN